MLLPTSREARLRASCSEQRVGRVVAQRYGEQQRSVPGRRRRRLPARRRRRGVRDRPPGRAAGTARRRWRSATASRDAAPLEVDAPVRDSKLTSRSLGPASSKRVTSVVEGRGGATPSPYTSTRSGTPDDSSVQTSTRAIVERGSAGHEAQAERRCGRRPVADGSRRQLVGRAPRAAGRPASPGRCRCRRAAGWGSTVTSRAVAVLVGRTGSSGLPSRSRSVSPVDAEPVDPPVLRVAPPHPQVGVLAEQPRDAAERRAAHGQLEGPLGAHLAGPADAACESPDPVGERRRRRCRCRTRAARRQQGRGSATPTASSATTSQRAAGTISTTYDGVRTARRTGTSTSVARRWPHEAGPAPSLAASSPRRGRPSARGAFSCPSAAGPGPAGR